MAASLAPYSKCSPRGGEPGISTTRVPGAVLSRRTICDRPSGSRRWGMPLSDERAAGEDKVACLKNTSTARRSTVGAMSTLSNPVMLRVSAGQKCPATGRRIIRYMGVQPRGKTVIMCQEQAFAEGQRRGDRYLRGCPERRGQLALTHPIDACPKEYFARVWLGFHEPKLVTGRLSQAAYTRR